jgi:hypothetical protein
MTMQKKPAQTGANDRLKDYIQVNDRIAAFWKKYPNGRLHSEIVKWEDGILIMRALAWRDINDQFPAAVGHAYEKEGSSYINNSSILENAETSVYGRVLAALGFEISKSMASREEVANAMKQQEEAAQEPDRLHDPAIKAKWQMLAGDLQGYEDGINKLRGKGYTFAQIEEYLTAKIKAKKEQTTE